MHPERQDGVNALRAQAAAKGAVVALLACGFPQEPLEVFGVLALEHQAVDAKARGFGLRQASGGTLRRRGQPHIDGPLLLLAQRAFALLLALFLDEGLGG